jgi:undecaprenyl pyrophosphate phosphatase UppP
LKWGKKMQKNQKWSFLFVACITLMAILVKLKEKGTDQFFQQRDILIVLACFAALLVIAMFGRWLKKHRKD